MANKRMDTNRCSFFRVRRRSQPPNDKYRSNQHLGDGCRNDHTLFGKVARGQEAPRPVTEVDDRPGHDPHEARRFALTLRSRRDGAGVIRFVCRYLLNHTAGWDGDVLSWSRWAGGTTRRWLDCDGFFKEEQRRVQAVSERTTIVASDHACSLHPYR